MKKYCFLILLMSFFLTFNLNSQSWQNCNPLEITINDFGQDLDFGNGDQQCGCSQNSNCTLVKIKLTKTINGVETPTELSSIRFYPPLSPPIENNYFQKDYIDIYNPYRSCSEFPAGQYNHTYTFSPTAPAGDEFHVLVCPGTESGQMRGRFQEGDPPTLAKATNVQASDGLTNEVNITFTAIPGKYYMAFRNYDQDLNTWRPIRGESNWPQATGNTMTIMQQYGSVTGQQHQYRVVGSDSANPENPRTGYWSDVDLGHLGELKFPFLEEEESNISPLPDYFVDCPYLTADLENKVGLDKDGNQINTGFPSTGNNIFGLGLFKGSTSCYCDNNNSDGFIMRLLKPNAFDCYNVTMRPSLWGDENGSNMNHSDPKIFELPNCNSFQKEVINDVQSFSFQLEEEYLDLLLHIDQPADGGYWDIYWEPCGNPSTTANCCPSESQMNLTGTINQGVSYDFENLEFPSNCSGAFVQLVKDLNGNIVGDGAVLPFPCNSSNELLLEVSHNENVVDCPFNLNVNCTNDTKPDCCKDETLTLQGTSGQGVSIDFNTLFNARCGNYKVKSITNNKSGKLLLNNTQFDCGFSGSFTVVFENFIQLATEPKKEPFECNYNISIECENPCEGCFQYVNNSGQYLNGHGPLSLTSRCMMNKYSDTYLKDGNQDVGTSFLNQSSNLDIHVFHNNSKLFEIKGDKDEAVSEIFRDQNNDLYITGSFNSPNLNFNPVSNLSNFKTDGSTFDGFVSKYDNSNNLKWAFNFGASFQDVPEDFIQIDEDEFIIVGKTFNCADFDGDPNRVKMTCNAGQVKGFVAKYTENGNTIPTCDWVRSFETEGTNSTSGAYGVTIMNDNIYVVGGYETSSSSSLVMKDENCISSGNTINLEANFQGGGYCRIRPQW